MEHRQREGELLAHASREPAGEPGAGPLEARLLEEALRARLALGAGEAVGGGHELDVLAHAQVVVQTGRAGDVAYAAPRRPPHGAAARPDHPGERAQQGGLAGAVAADHGGDRASWSFQSHAVQGNA